MPPLLNIAHLKAGIQDQPILTDLTLSLTPGEFTTLMGPNGSGKSTLAHILAGHPSYEVTSGTISFDGQDLLALTPEERAAAGLFLAFQYPATLSGVPISQFLRLCLNAQQRARKEVITGVADFIKQLRVAMRTLGIPADFAQRSVGEGFSGGEKKRLEMLQMFILRPKLAILDEIDSGLDVDAIKVVASTVNQLHQEGMSVLLITHYRRLLDYTVPDTIHIMKQGQIIKTGTAKLADQIEAEGYGS